MKSSNFVLKRIGALFAAALSLLSISQARAQILWYNGDNNGVDNIYATDNTASTNLAIKGNSGIAYDDFIVTSPTGWQVNEVFGYFLLPNTVSSANWVILSGVSAGNGGTVVPGASGVGSVTLTAMGGPNGHGNTLYDVAVTSLNFDLAPGRYWLGLQPISTGAGYLVTTSGANAIGTPAGNDGDAFWTGATYGIPNNGQYFENTTNVYYDLSDFSLGVDGAPISVPEPASWALTLVCVAAVAFFRARSGRV